jgi:flagellar M-ring protein FliF
MAEAVVDNAPAKSGQPASKPPLFGMAFLENISQMPMLRQVGLLEMHDTAGT